MERLYEPKHPAVERINPKRQVPVLIDGSTEIFDSTQIFEYLEDAAPTPPLWPTSVVDRELYSGPLSMFGAKAQIALHEKGLPFDLVMVPFDWRSQNLGGPFSASHCG